MSGLRIGPGLTLPLDAVTETFVILAKRGAGKTYTAAVMAEEMLDAGLPVCVIDPLGVWWGLRSSADGKSEGHSVVIFGGEHADVPLEETAGQLIADVIIDQRFPAVLDLSLLSKSASRRFMTAFLSRLYHRNRDPLHVIVDEADLFAPQSGGQRGGDGAALLGAMEDLVRRGRAKGIGATLITQRPAVLHKDVMSQAEVLVALRMTGVRDVNAIDEWVKLHAEEETARELKASLPSLPIGTAWVWSPGWLDVLQKVAVRKRRTFDSSATPKMGERRAAPKRMADVDLEALGAQIAATVERAKAEDPRELRRRITVLERERDEALADRPEPIVERVEVPVLAEDLVVRLEGILGDLQKHGQQAVDVSRDMLDQLHRWHAPPAPKPPQSARAHVPATTPQRRPSVPREPAVTASGEDLQLGKTERTILAVMAQHGPRTHRQLAQQSGYSPKASTIGVAMSKLRKAGYAEPGQPYAATQAGVDWLGDTYEPLPEGQALLDYWRSKFGKTEQLVLTAVLDAYPSATSLHEVAEVTGYSPTASTIGVAMSKLRRVELIEGWRVTDDFARAIGLSS